MWLRNLSLTFYVFLKGMLLVTSIQPGFATLFHTTSLYCLGVLSVYVHWITSICSYYLLLTPCYLSCFLSSSSSSSAQLFLYWVFILILFSLFSGYTISNQCFHPDPSFIQYTYTQWHLSLCPPILSATPPSIWSYFSCLWDNKNLKRVAVKYDYS